MLIQHRWEILGLCHLSQYFFFSVQRFKACGSWCEWVLFCVLGSAHFWSPFPFPASVTDMQLGETVCKETQGCCWEPGAVPGAGMLGLSSMERAVLCPAVQTPMPQGLDGEGMAQGRKNPCSFNCFAPGLMVLMLFLVLVRFPSQSER